jgi:hypothetical protein
VQAAISIDTHPRPLDCLRMQCITVVHGASCNLHRHASKALGLPQNPYFPPDHSHGCVLIGVLSRWLALGARWLPSSFLGSQFCSRAGSPDEAGGQDRPLAVLLPQVLHRSLVLLAPCASSEITRLPTRVAPQRVLGAVSRGPVRHICSKQLSAPPLRSSYVRDILC